MTDERPPPTTVVQATGQVASDLIGGLKQSPVVLLIVCLNLAFLAAATIFLVRVEDHRRETVKEYFELIDACFKQSGKTGSLILPLPRENKL